MSKENNQTDEEIEAFKNSLSEKVNGLLFPSETDSPIDVVSIADVENIKSKLAADNNVTKDAVTEVNFEEFLKMYGTEQDWQNPIQKDFATKFGDALKMLRGRLSEVQIFRVGSGVRAIIYLIGKEAENIWIGIKTTIVET